MTEATTKHLGINKYNLFWISLVHLVSVFSIFYFSWGGVFLCLFGLFVMAPLGINIGYHRLLTHRGFKSAPWLRYTFATLGAITAGGPPIQWAAGHRLHHRHSDKELDPHNSTKGFWYSHILHLFQENEFDTNEKFWKKYVPDLLAEPYLVFLNKYWLLFALAYLPVLYALGGISFVLWGGFLRVVVCWHVMWLVNSASHKWGYRTYETSDNTRNCWWVGLLASGEGWHNNHHADPMSAAHGHKWWELDLSFMVIHFLEILGLVKDVKRPRGVADFVPKRSF